MKQHMRRQRHSYHPSDYTTTTGPSQSVPSQGSRKRKAISEIFPTRDGLCVCVCVCVIRNGSRKRKAISEIFPTRDGLCVCVCVCDKECQFLLSFKNILGTLGFALDEYVYMYMKRKSCPGCS